MFKIFHSIFQIPYSRFSFPARREKAFTLLELLIVIGITTVLSGVGVSYYASQRKANLLDATARDITGYLRYVQRKSIAQQEGKQWGVHFENPSSGNDFYALYSGTTYSTPIEIRYLPTGIEFQDPAPGSSTDISFDKLTGSFNGSYKQIILKDSQSNTVNILACAQGMIEDNSDISLCGFVDTNPPIIGTVIPENTSYNSFVDSPFDLTASINDSEGGVTSCEYTTDGGTNWLAADLSGTGPDYTCTKAGITSSDGTSLSLNMRATSSGGTGTGTAVDRTVDTAAPTVSDNWTDNWTASSTVDITLTSSDGSGSGVASTKYCVDTANSCTPSTEGTSLSVSCDSGATCVQYVRYNAIDNVGNVSNIYSERVRQDLQAPSDGTLTATNDHNDEIDLSWSDFSDAGIGLRSTNTYKLVYSISATPTDCNDGTQIYLGTNTSYNHTGLTNGDTYYYRVCAFDDLDHISSGTTAQATVSGVWYCDEDNDGHYAVASATSCPSGRYSSSAGDDCDDSDNTKYQYLTGYTDSDGDGYGVGSAEQICSGSSLPSGYASQGDDCCDSDANAYPGTGTSGSTVDDCNSWDYNCDGQIEKTGCDEKTSTVSNAYAIYTNDTCNTYKGDLGKNYDTEIVATHECGESFKSDEVYEKGGWEKTDAGECNWTYGYMDYNIDKTCYCQ